MRNPLRSITKALTLLFLVLYIAHAAYAQGVQHAIVTAVPAVDGDSIVIEYDGQLHEYR